MNVFSRNQIQAGTKSRNESTATFGNGRSHPPRNNVVSTVATTLFLGGWLRPFPNVAVLSFLDFVPAWIWFLLKTFMFLYVFLWVRATLPRYRYDQLMRLGWKVLIPVAIGNVVVTGIVKVLLL